MAEATLLYPALVLTGTASALILTVALIRSLSVRRIADEALHD